MTAVVQDVYACHGQAPALDDGAYRADERRCFWVGVEGDGVRRYPGGDNNQVADYTPWRVARVLLGLLEVFCRSLLRIR